MKTFSRQVNNRKNCRLCGQSGESLIVAIILTLIFLTIGAAILTAAGNSLTTANQRVTERQTYYLAQSALDTVTESMMGGELGQTLRDKAYQDFAESEQKEKVEKWELTPSVQLSSSELNDFSIADMEIRFQSKITKLQSEGQTAVNLKNIEVSFTAKYADRDYRVKAVYSYSSVHDTINDPDNKEWTGEEWEIVSVSQ